MPLTDTHIRSLKPDVKPRKYFDGGGLFLYVPTSGSKLWRMAYRYNGKSKAQFRGISHRIAQGCQRTP